MKRVFLFSFLIYSATSFAQPKKHTTASKSTTPKTATKMAPILKSTLKTSLDSVSYGMGVNIGSTLKQQNLGGIDPKLLIKGLNDLLSKLPLMISENVAMQTIQNYVASSNKEASPKINNAEKINIKTLRDSASYCIGNNIATSFNMQGLGNINSKLFSTGLTDFLMGRKTQLTEDVANACVGAYMQKQSASKSEPLKAEGKKFLAANAKKQGIKTMPEGWQYEVLKASDSKEFPLATDKVKCHYKGTLIDGTVFDESYGRGEPIVFPLNGVIKGWTIALQKMNVGSKWKIYLPSDLAYGDRGTGDKIGPGATLIFEVELLGIEK